LEVLKVVFRGSLKEFATALFDKLDKLDKLEREQKKQGEELKAQTQKIERIKEIFDMILINYFEEMKKGVKEFNAYVQRITENEGKELETPQGREMLLNRIELLKDKAELVEETTVELSSEQLQAIYRAIVPDIKKEIDQFHENIVDHLHNMYDATTNNILKNTRAVLGTITNHNTIVEGHMRNLIAKINTSEKAIIQGMPGNRNNVYRD